MVNDIITKEKGCSMLSALSNRPRILFEVKHVLEAYRVKTDKANFIYRSLANVLKGFFILKYDKKNIFFVENHL